MVLFLNAFAIASLIITTLRDRFGTPRFVPAILTVFLLTVASGAQAAAGARMRAPITPLLAIFAVVAVAAVPSTLRRGRDAGS